MVEGRGQIAPPTLQNPTRSGDDLPAGDGAMVDNAIMGELIHCYHVEYEIVNG